MLFNRAIDQLSQQAQAVELQIAALQEQLSQIQSQIQAVRSVEQAAESAITQVKQALAGIRQIDPSLETQFEGEIQACFDGQEVNLLKAAIDYDETEPQTEPEAPTDPDIKIAEVVGEIEPETPQEQPETLPNLIAWTVAELRKAIERLGGQVPKKASKKDLIMEIVRIHHHEKVSVDRIKEVLNAR